MNMLSLPARGLARPSGIVGTSRPIGWGCGLVFNGNLTYIYRAEDPGLAACFSRVEFAGILLKDFNAISIHYFVFFTKSLNKTMSDTALKNPKRPVMLCILDGWGDRKETENNAVALAETPNWDRLTASCPTAHLQASETFVGLPKGQMGNSEVGHMNLGAGRIVLQDLPRIDEAFEKGTVGDNPQFQQLISKVKQSGGRIHLMGLMSPGGVHAHQDHMAGLANLLHQAGIEVLVHAFLDGRDTAPQSAVPYLEDFQAAAPDAKIATLCGRYYAMDRDKNWDRVEGAYHALTAGKGLAAEDAVAAVKASYEDGKNDEFVLPTVLSGYDGMKDGDAILMANFRADRAREILTSLLDPAFDGFARNRDIQYLRCCGHGGIFQSIITAFLDILFPAAAASECIGFCGCRSGSETAAYRRDGKIRPCHFLL